MVIQRNPGHSFKRDLLYALPGQGNAAGIDRKIRQVKGQIRQVKENQHLTPEEQERRIRRLEKKLEELKQKKLQEGGGQEEPSTSPAQGIRTEDWEGEQTTMEVKGRMDTFQFQRRGRQIPE